MKRNTILTTGELYHIYNKSIYGYVIFNSSEEYERLRAMIFFYQWQQKTPFCHFLKSSAVKKSGLWIEMANLKEHPRLVEIITYCFMPTHVHFVLKQLMPDGISLFMKRLLGGYTLYFNYRHNRKGPLWQNRFGNRLIKDDKDLWATKKYVHENPIKDLNLQSPGEWIFSSYLEYEGKVPDTHKICTCS
jgi:putative transposase